MFLNLLDNWRYLLLNQVFLVILVRLNNFMRLLLDQALLMLQLFNFLFEHIDHVFRLFVAVVGGLFLAGLCDAFLQLDYSRDHVVHSLLIIFIDFRVKTLKPLSLFRFRALLGVESLLCLLHGRIIPLILRKMAKADTLFPISNRRLKRLLCQILQVYLLAAHIRLLSNGLNDVQNLLLLFLRGVFFEVFLSIVVI